MRTEFDSIVVGAGPAGSTAARHLARGGARVLLLDRETFPRSKPCGGGVTERARRELGIDLFPVAERTITKIQFSLRGRNQFCYSSERPLVHMTQRHRLDAYLANAAVDAGGDFRDSVRVLAIEPHGSLMRVSVEREHYVGRTIICADGVNGTSASMLGLDPVAGHVVALEADVLLKGQSPDPWRESMAVDLGGIPGGYAWMFPKADVFNVGVGGWLITGKTLRRDLGALIQNLGFDTHEISSPRGYRLPLRRRGSRLVRGQALLVGDAAGLVDPFSYEGLYAAFLSGRLAAAAILDYLEGEAHSLSPYERSVDAKLMPEIMVGYRLQAIFQRLPALSVQMLHHNSLFWRYMTEIIRGEITYPDLPRKLGPLRHALNAWADWEIRRGERQRGISTSSRSELVANP